MKEYMPILYALQSGKLKQEDFVNYKPDACKYMNIDRPSLFSFGRDTLKTEFDLGWHAIIYKDFGVLLVSDKATEATITVLQNPPSYETLKSYAFLYENSEFESNSVVPTHELYQEIPENLRQKNVWCYQERQKSNFRRLTTRNSHRRDPSRTHSYRNNSGPTYYSKHMQPLVFIPFDTIIEIENGRGTTQENAFKLLPRSIEQNRNSSKHFDVFNEPTVWVSLTEAIMARRISQTDFVEYVPDKNNELIIQKANKSDSCALDGWNPILCIDKGIVTIQIVSASFDCFKTDVWDDILNENIKCSMFENCTQHESNVRLLELYAKLDTSKVKMVILISNKTMVELNNPQYDGSTPTRAYRLKIESEE